MLADSLVKPQLKEVSSSACKSQLALFFRASLASTCAILTPDERCSSENVAERAFSFWLWLFWLLWLPPFPPPPAPQLWLPLPLEMVAEEVEAARFSDAT